MGFKDLSGKGEGSEDCRLEADKKDLRRAVPPGLDVIVWM